MDGMRAVCSAVAMKTRSPQIVGEACPRPGTGTFQMIAWVRLQCRGGRLSALLLSRVVPRHHGQSSGPGFAGGRLSSRAGSGPTTAGSVLINMLRRKNTPADNRNRENISPHL